MGSKKSTSTSKVTLPGWLEGASAQAVQMGTNIANKPYTPYTGERVAGLSANEQQAGTLSQTGYKQAGDLMQQGATMAGSIKKWGDTTDAEKQSYEQPYINNVVNPAVAKVNKTYQTQSDTLSGKADKQAAFGADNPVLARQALDRGVATTISDTKATGAKNAYDFAMGQWNNDQTLKASTASALSQVGGDMSKLTGQQVQDLMRTGGAARYLQQQNNDFNYGQFVENRDWDIHNLEPLVNALGQVGSMYGTKTQSGSQPSGAAGQILGAATTVAGAYFGSKGSPSAAGGTGAGMGSDIGGAGSPASNYSDIGGGGSFMAGGDSGVRVA